MTTEDMTIDEARCYGDLARVSKVAGDYLGTDPEMQTSGCVDALVIHAEQLRERAERAEAEQDALRTEVNQLLDRAILQDRRHAAELAAANAHIDDLAHQATHVTCRMAQGEMDVQLEAALAERDTHRVARFNAEHALDAVMRQTCDTCACQWQSPTGHLLCGKVSVPGHSVARVLCSMLGGGCRGWRELEANVVLSGARTGLDGA
jgi:hypothetical protein